ncbi:MAG: hypothetical protein R3F61_14800 [Myxococcota bacterium]
MRAALVLFTALTACNVVDPVDVTEFVNEGTLCTNANGDVVVDWQTCLSSSCDTLTDAECTATLDGTDLALESYGRIESQGLECTDDCGFAVATCTLPTIADPTQITVTHGTTTVTLSDLPDCSI